MRDDTKRWIDDIAYSIYYLFQNEPWLSYRGIKEEMYLYYDCSKNDFEKAFKIAERWDRYGCNN